MIKRLSNTGYETANINNHKTKCTVLKMLA